ncbi:restriction endonuclease subunit S [Pseudomonas putida]|uniref:restriction endonuclease subunit S n=1 Tax=Pseudomonas putida TaxID=303 RepID=UPI002DBB1171|nr:restriction endonuclease subunit S [Pseudomonas putida]WRW04073.1 restriction endonuclease subunit S [Pseudomonas putida]
MSWPLVAIKEVAKVVTGKTPSTVDDQNFGGDIPFVTPAELGLETYVTSAPRTLSAKGASTIKLVPKNAVMVCCIGSLGKMAIAGTPVATNQQINSVIFDENRVDAKYGFYALQLLKPKMEAMAPSTTVAIVNKGNFEAMQIPLPPLPEQKRIAAILDKADAIRRKRQQAIQLADGFLRAVFLDMFGDPVTNPKGWDVKPLSAGIRSISSGWSASGENRPCSDGEKGVLKISAVTSGVFKPEENKTVPLDQIPEGKKLLFPKRGDLLFSRANTRELVAASCIVMTNVEDVFLPDKLWLVETDQKKLLPEFLNYLLWQPRFKERLTSQATGTSGSMLNISKSKFEETDAFFPNMELQEKFKRIYWALQETLDASASSREAGDSLFESLSQKAFSGQL